MPVRRSQPPPQLRAMSVREAREPVENITVEPNGLFAVRATRWVVSLRQPGSLLRIICEDSADAGHRTCRTAEAEQEEQMGVLAACERRLTSHMDVGILADDRSLR